MPGSSRGKSCAASWTTAHLIEAIGAAVKKTHVVAALAPGDDVSRELRSGKQFDARVIVRHDGLDGSLSDRVVVAYIAKYATKATEESFARCSTRMAPQCTA